MDKDATRNSTVGVENQIIFHIRHLKFFMRLPNEDVLKTVEYVKLGLKGVF